MQSFTGRELYLNKTDFVAGMVTEFGTIQDITDEHCKIGNSEWYYFSLQKEICACEIRIQEEKQLDEIHSVEEFFAKRTAPVLPPKDNMAEKNQNGSLDQNITVRNNLAVIKNTKRVRKSKRAKSMVRFIEEL